MSTQAKVVEVPCIQEPIQPSPGFEKKSLAEYKLDACGLCEFGCAYCSSPHGNYLRIRREKFADRTEQQQGERAYPAEDPHLMFTWPDYSDRLRAQLSKTPDDFGAGKTLVYSMLTDGFSPHLIQEGITETSLKLVLERTRFHIRVLTKNAVVGSRKWVNFFQEYRDRFVVGLSIGTLDDVWARSVERLTSTPTARLRALHRLQDAGVATFGMLCPMFPHVLQDDHLERLVDQIRPDIVEHVWAEPFNDRNCWEQVRDCCRPGSVDHRWLTDVYEDKGRKDNAVWSRYATDLYVQLRRNARREGWIGKLRYLLYEGDIVHEDACQFQGLDGVLLQSKPDPDGKSQNQLIAAFQ